ncbi:MAG TPA: M50 family metallopeptidase [Dehalococcoidia bacterium]|nr:M50 family metallopeptidase [Dehalococcoidia bacterium]
MAVLPGIAGAALLFILLLVPLVVIHEFGHFLAAKAFGIKVLEFGVGFPPKIRGKKFGETEYTINWLPIGGFVRLLGEEDPTDPRSLAAQAPWKRLTVLFAGVVMNVALAVALLSAGLMIPRERSLAMAQVVEVSPDSPAAEAVIEGQMRDGSEPLQGIQSGDLIIEVEGREVRNTQELILANRLNLGETQDWVIVRANSTLTAQVYARWHPPADQGPTGIRVGAPIRCSGIDDEGELVDCELRFPFTETVWRWPWEAVPEGIQDLADVVVLNVNELRVRFGGGGGGAAVGDGPVIQGPVGLAATTKDIVGTAGWRPLIELAALFSLNLAVFNALPLPMLDGGRALFVFIEIIRGGRRVAPEKEALVHLLGFVSLMTLVLFITFFDVQRLVT